MMPPQGGHDDERFWDRGELIGALVLAVAAMAWFGWAQDDPPRPWVPFLIAGSVVAALVSATLVVLLVRHRTTGSVAMADARVRRNYWIVVTVEFAAIAAGNLVLASAGHADYQAAWTLFIVGIHFVPLGRVLRIRNFVPTGIATAGVAVTAAILGLTTSLASSAVAGAGGGIVFIAHAAGVLITGRSRRRPAR